MLSTYIGTKRQPCRLVLVQKSSNTILYISKLRFRLRGLNFFTASTPSHSRSRREILRPQLHGARRITVDRKTRKEKKGAIIYIICSCWAKTYARYGKARRIFLSARIASASASISPFFLPSVRPQTSISLLT